jgi:hypothetical protein
LAAFGRVDMGMVFIAGGCEEIKGLVEFQERR